MALSGLALLALPAGIEAGRLAAQSLGGIDAATITLAVHDQDGPARSSASAVIRRDGVMVGLTGPGYESVHLDESVRSDLFALLREGQSSWADAYAAPGATTRLSIAIAGSHPRTVSVDSPLANPSLPDSLFRFMVLAERQFAVPRPDAAEASPPGLIVYARPLPSDVTARPTALPVGLVDAVAASAEDGQQLGSDASARLRAALPAAATYVYPLNAAAVELDGHGYLVTWVADWTAWAGAGS